eukprot:3527304-Rhodomonas_salina.2
MTTGFAALRRELAWRAGVDEVHVLCPVKLSKVSRIPESRTVYRGLEKMRMPEQFWIPDENGFCGGVRARPCPNMFLNPREHT